MGNRTARLLSSYDQGGGKDESASGVGSEINKVEEAIDTAKAFFLSAMAA